MQTLESGVELVAVNAHSKRIVWAGNNGTTGVLDVQRSAIRSAVRRTSVLEVHCFAYCGNGRQSWAVSEEMSVLWTSSLAK